MFPILLSIAILFCWAFPYIWYTNQRTGGDYFWLAEQSDIEGWQFKEEPLEEAAEALLVADKTVSGSFTSRSGRVVHVFSAKRFQKKENDSDLFVHTPDRCWTEGGWRIEPIKPDFVTLRIHGVSIQFERRIFSASQSRELVYFCGLMDGAPLPFRLNHNLSVAIRYQLKEGSGTFIRATDLDQWMRILESFRSRRSLLGPKQFIRISTPVGNGDIANGDQLLQNFLNRWLLPGNFHTEAAIWNQNVSDLKASSVH